MGIGRWPRSPAAIMPHHGGIRPPAGCVAEREREREREGAPEEHAAACLGLTACPCRLRRLRSVLLLPAMMAARMACGWVMWDGLVDDGSSATGASGCNHPCLYAECPPGSVRRGNKVLSPLVSHSKCAKLV